MPSIVCDSRQYLGQSIVGVVANASWNCQYSGDSDSAVPSIVFESRQYLGQSTVGMVMTAFLYELPTLSDSAVF